MYTEKAYFEKEDLSFISLVLRQVFDIPRDKAPIVEEFIKALDSGANICSKEGE